MHRKAVEINKKILFQHGTKAGRVETCERLSSFRSSLTAANPLHPNHKQTRSDDNVSKQQCDKSVYVVGFLTCADRHVPSSRATISKQNARSVLSIQSRISGICLLGENGSVRQILSLNEILGPVLSLSPLVPT